MCKHTRLPTSRIKCTDREIGELTNGADAGPAGSAPAAPAVSIFQHWNTAALLLIAAGLIGWWCPNYVMQTAPRTDSGVFIAVAHHLRSGKVLYRDVWDHKPPMIHFLNRTAIMGQEVGIDGVRYMEKGFGSAMSALFFLIVFTVFSNAWVAFLSVLYFLLLFYNPVVFEGGNLTEEYGAFFFLLTVACSLPVRVKKYPRLCSFSNGLFAGFACLTKEPYLFACLPWLVGTWFWARKESHNMLRTILFQMAGVIVALLPFLLYFTWHSALMDWMKVVAYNFSYSAINKTTIGNLIERTYFYAAERVFYQSYLCLVIAFASVWSLVKMPYQRDLRFFPWVAGFSMLFAFAAAGLSNIHFGHYYMMIVPVWVLFLVSGANWVMMSIVSVRGWVDPLMTRLGGQPVLNRASGLFATAVLCLLILVFVPFTRSVIVRVAGPEYALPKSVSLMLEGVAHYQSSGSMKELLPIEVLRREGLWAQGGYCRYYAECGALSPTPYIYAFDHLFMDTALDSKEERLAVFRRNLEARPPAVLVMGNFSASLPENDEFLKNKYTRVSRPSIAEIVFVRNDLLAMVKRNTDGGL